MTDEAIIPVNLRSSKSHEWLTCPKRAEFRNRVVGAPVEMGGEAVAITFGNMVHERLTGHAAQQPRAIMFDRVTRSHNELARQVDEVAAFCAKALSKTRVVHTELYLKTQVRFNSGVQVNVSGHIDLGTETPVAETLDLVDIKTGRIDQRYALIQLAIYCFLAQHNGIWVRDGILLWVPRGKNDISTYDEKNTMTLRRPAEDLRQYAAQIINHVAGSIHNPLAVPGTHCSNCEHIKCLFHPQKDVPLN